MHYIFHLSPEWIWQKFPSSLFICMEDEVKVAGYNCIAAVSFLDVVTKSFLAISFIPIMIGNINVEDDNLLLAIIIF